MGLRGSWGDGNVQEGAKHLTEEAGLQLARPLGGEGPHPSACSCGRLGLCSRHGKGQA